MTGAIAASGDVTSLTNGYGGDANLTESCFLGMFFNCSSLTEAPALPATTLANCCYYQMFSGCTSLTEAPALPATTLADCCYYQMFSGCTELHVAKKSATYEIFARIAFFTCPSLAGITDSTKEMFQGTSFTGTPVEGDTFYTYTSKITLDQKDPTTAGTVSIVYAFCDNALPVLSGTMPVKENWIFRGYFDEETGGNKYYNADGSISSEKPVWDKSEVSVNLYAHWEKDDINGAIVAAIEDCKYSGSAQTPTPDVTYDGNKLTRDFDYLLSYSNNTDAGTATLTVTGAGIYCGDKQVTFIITKRSVTLSSASAQNEYNGLPITKKEVTESGDGFAGDEGATYTVTGSRKDAGSSPNTFQYELKANTKEKNYIITTVDGTLTITQKEATLTWSAPSGLVYDKTAKTPTADVGNLIHGDDCSVTASVTGGTDNVNVGKFTFTATALSNSNYKLPSTTVSDEYEIAAKELTVKDTIVDDKVYDGTADIKVSQNGTLNGIIDGDVVTITKATATATDTNTGTAIPVTVQFELSGDAASNYTVKNVTSLTVTIAKATPGANDFTVTLPESLVYDGTDKTVKVSPKHEGTGSIIVKYYQDGKEVASAKAVGPYTFKLVVDGGSNYNAGTVSADSWTFTITDAPPVPSGGPTEDAEQVVIVVGTKSLTEAQKKAVEILLEEKGITLVNVLNISKKTAEKENFTATITIEPKYFEGYNPDTLKVWKVNDDNTLTLIPFTVVDGKIIIHNGKFGNYIITVD